MEKHSGMDTSQDIEHPLRQRHEAATLSEGAERVNAANINGITDELITRKPEMARRCKEQLGDLFPASTAGNSYGRARAVGMTAREASELVTRAFKK